VGGIQAHWPSMQSSQQLYILVNHYSGKDGEVSVAQSNNDRIDWKKSFVLSCHRRYV